MRISSSISNIRQSICCHSGSDMPFQPKPRHAYKNGGSCTPFSETVIGILSLID